MASFGERQADAVFEFVSAPASRSRRRFGLHHRDESDLWLYWVSGKGRAKWTAAPEPLVALYEQLLKHMTPTQARATALSWFEDGMGRPVGPKDGQIPVTEDEEKSS